MEVRSKIPTPKKTLSMIPIAVSLFSLVVLVIPSINNSESQPVINAPIIKYSGFLLPETIKAKHTPGKILWAIASPTSARFLRNEKQPTIAAEAPKSIVPNTTKSTLGSEKERNWNVLFNYEYFSF